MPDWVFTPLDTAAALTVMGTAHAPNVEGQPNDLTETSARADARWYEGAALGLIDAYDYADSIHRCAEGNCSAGIVIGALIPGISGQMGRQLSSRITKFGILPVKDLRIFTKGTGLDSHHIIEQRFAKTLGLDPDMIPGIALTKEEHQAFTNAWRDLIGYSNSHNPLNTLTATREDIWKAARQIYADFPDLLEAARRTLYPE